MSSPIEPDDSIWHSLNSDYNESQIPLKLVAFSSAEQPCLLSATVTLHVNIETLATVCSQIFNLDDLQILDVWFHRRLPRYRTAYQLLQGSKQAIVFKTAREAARRSNQ